MSVALQIEGNEVSGEFAIAIPPGTKAKKIDAMIQAEIADALHAAAEQLGTVLGTYPRRYARPLPGKDAEGRTRYAVRARREGDRLVPAHTPPEG